MERTLFEALGGDDGIARLVDRFYDRVLERPDAAVLRAMHPADLAETREKLKLFLTGWSGGPPRYVERFGHPRLRARHLPFAIDGAARDAWIACMRDALEAEVADPQLREQLHQSFLRVADHMRNTPDPT